MTDETQKHFDAAREYINAAPTKEERNLRKRDMYTALYSSGPVSFAEAFAELRKLREQKEQS